VKPTGDLCYSRYMKNIPVIVFNRSALKNLINTAPAGLTLASDNAHDVLDAMADMQAIEVSTRDDLIKLRDALTDIIAGI